MTDSMIETDALPDWVRPGAKFRDETNRNDPDLWHVRGIVDGLAVVRRWRIAKRRWHYEVLGPIFFEVRERGLKPIA